MVGKHIFVRCRDEQNNAGTWTAAMTEHLVDKDVVRNYIEPRCNMDETFAQTSLISCPSNNVLRMYYVNASTLVITRTYWVTDRITETQGRRGAYSVSYLLTGEDVTRFCADFGGAFDVSCFESYDKLVARVLENPNHRITIDETEDIFRHKELDADASILEKCGFTEQSFIAFMNALYDAVENKKQAAVILPAKLREAWVTGGDDSAEKCAAFVLKLLPDFMRINVGFASHWNCLISDKMVGDMPLIFVHPKSEEDIAYLKREGAHVIDLDGGRFSSAIPQSAESYFGFVWKNRASLEVCEDFWTYCKTNFKKLLRGKPTSAAAMECLYQIRETMAHTYADAEKCRKALLLAAKEFAGAGTRVPLAEEFLYEAIHALGLERKAADPELEDALRILMTQDTEKTKHQLQEYTILLSAVENGTASPETVAALCEEVTKEERNAVSFFFSYLTDKQKLPKEKISPQMTQLAASLFSVLSRNPGNASSSELMYLILKAIWNWSSVLTGGSAWQKFILPAVDAYVAYLKTDQADAACIGAIYRYLFVFYYKADGEIREKCEKALMREEIKIYKKPDAVLSDGARRSMCFAEAFLDSFPLVLEAGKEVAPASFERLYRMMFHPVEEISEKAFSVYETVTPKVLSMAPKMAGVLLQCEENALADRPPVWTKEHTEQTVLALEYSNMKMLDSYYPSVDRLQKLIGELRLDNPEAYTLFGVYAEKMPFDARQSLYKVLLEKNMLVRFFVYILLYTDKDTVKREMETLLHTFSHFELLKSILALHDPLAKEEAAENRFRAWYMAELEGILIGAANGKADAFGYQYDFLSSEFRVLYTFPYGSSEIVTIAYDMLYTYAGRIFGGLSSEVIGKLPLAVITNVLQLQNKSTVSRTLHNQADFELAKQADEVILSSNTSYLYALCEANRLDPQKSLILRERLTMKLEEGSCGSPLACRMYSVFLEGRTGVYPLSTLLNMLDYEHLEDTEKGDLLVDIMLQMHNDRAAFERETGMEIMTYLQAIAEENPSALLEKEFTERWRLVKPFEYTKTSNFLQLMRRAYSNTSLRFDLKMLVLCLIGAIFTCLVIGFGGKLLFRLAAANLFIALPVLVLLLAAVGFADGKMLTDLVNSKQRRK